MSDIKTPNFETYLQEVCFEANPAILDDDMPDFFDDWMSSQEPEDLIRLANEYGQHILTTHSLSILKALEERYQAKEIEQEVDGKAYRTGEIEIEDALQIAKELLTNE